MRNDPRLRSLRVLEPHPCSYFPERTARSRAALASTLDPEIYHDLMDLGCRRSGSVIYTPVCDGCSACVSIRVPVATFHPNRSQRRCRIRNADLSIEVRAPAADDEAYALYHRYQRDWHGKLEPDDRLSMEHFLYRSPVHSIEMRYRSSDGQLLAVGICDVCSRSLSSVYFFHDPDHRSRGLGVFGALVEIDFARAHGIPHYYLGYWIDGCRTMQYKRDFQPCEVLDSNDGLWHPLASDS